MSAFLLSTIVYYLVTSLTFKDTLRRFGLLKTARRDFYECGFKPQHERPINVSLQFLLICIFFLIYDIELVFLFPFTAGVSYIGFYEFLLLSFFFLLFLISLIVDYDRHALM